MRQKVASVPALALVVHRFLDMRISGVFLALTLTAFAAFGQSSSTVLAGAPTPLDEARKLADSGQWDAALQRLDTLAVSQPQTPGLANLRGMIYYEQGKMPEAADTFAKAVVQNPKDFDSMQMEGVSLFRQGKPALAIPLLQQAHAAVANTRVDPDYVLALCFMDTHRYDDARKTFSAQYGFSPDSAPAYLLAARMFLRRDYLPIAEDSARKALSIDPNLPLAHLLMGEVALAAARYEEAIAEFDKEIALNPAEGLAYERLGDAYIRTGDFVNAAVALNKAVLLEPGTSGPYILLGKTLLKQKDPLMAQVYLERAARMDPTNYMAHSLLGQTYRALGRTEDATRENRKAEQLQATDTPDPARPK
jgi:tetratricopeptide (TPR) repeat protein